MVVTFLVGIQLVVVVVVELVEVVVFVVEAAYEVGVQADTLTRNINHSCCSLRELPST